MFRILSDKNCNFNTCRLKLGASTSCDSNLRRRREGLKYFGYTYLTKTFDSENGKKILYKCDKATEEKYEDVVNGKRKTLITCPPHFIYNSKLNTGFSVMEEELEKKIDDEELKSSSELKEILDFRKIYLPQAGERDIFNPLIGSFFHYPGIFVNGFEPNQYLKEFQQAAEELRRTLNANQIQKKVNSLMPSIVQHFPESESKNMIICICLG